jgi:thiamine-monophosphate kinase
MSPSGHLCDGNATVGGRFRRSRLARCVTVREAFITIAEYGEFALIAAIEKVLPDNAGLIVGIGDDAAVVRAADGRVVATADMLIEGRHFRKEWSAPRDIGGKAAARNLADIAAMGARPTALLVSFAAPGDLEVSWVLELVAGIAEEAAAAGAAVAGGDTSSADVVMLAVTALGDLAGRRPVTRSGARPGDVVAVAGTLGSAAAGLALLRAGAGAGAQPGAAGSAGSAGGAAGAESGGDVRPGSGDSELEPLIAAHRRPRPPYSAGPEAAALGATAMIDISDGLIADLGHVASASGVQIELRGSAIAADPVARRRLLTRAADLLGSGTDWQRWVLTGGDDHALAATFPPGLALPGRWTEIGRASEGHGILLDGRRWNEAGGWEHFLL